MDRPLDDRHTAVVDRKQTIATTRAGFMWRARLSPLACLAVADYFIEGQGGLEVRLLVPCRLPVES